MFIHIDIVKEMKARLRELTEDVDNEDDWLEDIPGDFARLNNLVEEDLTKPTAALSSLMYQSVSIRDSRHSLRLGTSMWRLSWITFIFLPLTFIVGFFGMNVGTFKNYPDIKWYFVAAVPFMLCVLIAWYVMKTFLARQRQTPYQRGIWEAYFKDLSVTNPMLWSRAGPRDYMLPKGRLNRFKWQLIKWWTAPEKTLHAANVNAEGAIPDDLGSWSRLKKLLIKRWTAQIRESLFNDQASSLEEGDGDDIGLIAEGLGEVTEMAALPGVPQVVENMPGGLLEVPLDPRVKIERRLPNPSPRRSASQQRPTSQGSSSDERNSGILVEEEDPKWLNERGREGKGWRWKAEWGRRSDEWRRRSGEWSRERDASKRRSGQSDTRGSSPSSPLAQTLTQSVQGQGLGEEQARGGRRTKSESASARPRQSQIRELVGEGEGEEEAVVGEGVEREKDKENVKGPDVPEIDKSPGTNDDAQGQGGSASR